MLTDQQSLLLSQHFWREEVVCIPHDELVSFNAISNRIWTTDVALLVDQTNDDYFITCRMPRNREPYSGSTRSPTENNFPVPSEWNVKPLGPSSRTPQLPTKRSSRSSEHPTTRQASMMSCGMGSQPNRAIFAPRRSARILSLFPVDHTEKWPRDGPSNLESGERYRD